MKNITLIIAFIIGTSFALSAQRGGTLGTNNNIDRTSERGTQGNTIGYTKNRGGSPNYGRPGNGGRPNGSGHNHNGHNNGHHNSHNNGHRSGHRNGYHGHNYNSYCNYSNHNYGWNPVCLADFNIGCRSIRGFSHESDRLRSARHFVCNHYVNSHQIADIMMMFRHESTRLEFAKYAFHRTCDVQNYGVVFDHLTYNSSRRELDFYVRDFQW